MDVNWIAADWGTSNLRLWAMDADGQILAQLGSPKGMGALQRDEFEPHLLDLTAGWRQVDLSLGRKTPVVACGMVGARQGWQEAHYLAVPTRPAPDNFTRVETVSNQLDVVIAPGVMQITPADVMRGEETQIAGVLRAEPDFDGVICMPGTHSKWARISAGEICHFQTVMTGELFAAIAGHTVLRHSLGDKNTPDDPVAFATAVSRALSQPERVLADLFGLRAAALVAGGTPEHARATLSGSLIGLELAATKSYWLGQDVGLVGAVALSQRYQTALAPLGVTARIFDADAAVLDGLRALRYLSKA